MQESGATSPALTESEAIACGVLAWSAAVMATAWLFDWAHLPIAPLPVLAAATLSMCGLVAALRRSGLRLDTLARPRLAAFLLVVVQGEADTV